MSCTPPWSHRDLFMIVTDCHVYQPVKNVLHTLIIILSIICLLYGTYEYPHRKNKIIPVVSMLIGILYGLHYLIMEITNLTFVDRNIIINLLHSLSRASVWLLIGVHSVSHLQFLINIDSRTIVQSNSINKHLKIFSYALYGINLPIELIIMLIPTFNSDLDLMNYIGPTGITLMFVNLVPRLYYAHKVRVIIREIKPSNLEFYTPLEKRITTIINLTFISSLLGEILSLCWVIVPFIRSNLYIVYNLQMLVAPFGGIVGLVITKGDRLEEDDNDTGLSKTEVGGSIDSNPDLLKDSKPQYRHPSTHLVPSSSQDLSSSTTPSRHRRSLSDTTTPYIEEKILLIRIESESVSIQPGGGHHRDTSLATTGCALGTEALTPSTPRTPSTPKTPSSFTKLPVFHSLTSSPSSQQLSKITISEESPNLNHGDENHNETEK